MRIALLFLFLSSLLFAQNPIVDLKIDSIEVTDFDDERKYTVHYHIENRTDKKISFLLDTSNNDTITGVKTNRIIPIIYQDTTAIKDFIFIKNYDYTEVFKFINDLRNSKTDAEEEAIKNDPEFKKLKIHPICLEKIIEKREPDYKKIRLFENNTIYKTLKTLEPKEIQHFQLILFWNKERYFKSEENEYYLEANSNYSIELSFSTKDFDYLYFDSTEGFEYDKSLFFNSETISNKVTFHFNE
ncbi:hypothetical protein [Flavobacterium sp.]|uniref:hypothetical protein n=1 Tax=Flavobacterium sp. TaxID=239 RepID=UPI002B4AEED3|nr:hypothetical protein [Flavobacterium sp.]HLP63526.1 hypothetical protein [Flavobacterium sp.]